MLVSMMIVFNCLYFLLDAVMKKKVVKDCPGIENNLDCNPPCSYKLKTVHGIQLCSAKYLAEYTTHFSETGRIGLYLYKIVIYKKSHHVRRSFVV